MFYAGVIGFVLSGMLLDTRIWWIALIGVLVSLGVAAFAYKNLDFSELEPLKTQEKKEFNRIVTFANWINGTYIERL